MKRKNFVISEFRFVPCLLYSTDFALLNHRFTRSPFPAGECKGATTLIQFVRRISFKLIILYTKLEDFY